MTSAQMARLRHGASRFARCVIGERALDLGGRSPLSKVASIADRRSMTACRTAPHGRPVETAPPGAGLAALRLAVAMHRDPDLGGTLDRVAFRAMQKTAVSSSAGAASAAAAAIPVPSPPSEPTGELAA